MTKRKPLGHSEMQSIGISKYEDGFTVKHDCQSYMKLSTHE